MGNGRQIAFGAPGIIAAAALTEPIARGGHEGSCEAHDG